ncbi:MAG: hypothetical protein VW683_00260 [Betaproteobacteria bacterium]|jgi:hypothetical protein
MKRKRKKLETIVKERIWCSVCKDVSIVSNSNVLNLICGDCVAREMLYEDFLKRKEEQLFKSFPRGWNLKKEFISDDGRIFNYGRENT